MADSRWELAEILQKRGWSLATAESCTGGTHRRGLHRRCQAPACGSSAASSLTPMPPSRRCLGRGRRTLIEARMAPSANRWHARWRLGAAATLPCARSAVAVTGVAGPDRRQCRQTGRHGLVRLGDAGRGLYRTPALRRQPRRGAPGHRGPCAGWPAGPALNRRCRPMAEPFKNLIHAGTVAQAGQHLQRVWPAFDRARFESLATTGLEDAGAQGPRHVAGRRAGGHAARKTSRTG
jgi:hypothetical protein